MYLSKIQIGWDTVNIRLHTGFDKGFFYFEKWEDGSRIGMSSPDIDLSSFFLVNQNEELIKWLNELPQWTRI